MPFLSETNTKHHGWHPPKETNKFKPFSKQDGYHQSHCARALLLHSSGKGQFKEQQTSSIYRRKYIRSSRTLMYIYIYIYIYAKHIAVCHLEYGLHNIEVRKNTDSHPNKWQQCKWTSMNVTLKQTVFTSSFFFLTRPFFFLTKWGYPKPLWAKHPLLLQVSSTSRF